MLLELLTGVPRDFPLRRDGVLGGLFSVSSEVDEGESAGSLDAAAVD